MASTSSSAADGKAEATAPTETLTKVQSIISEQLKLPLSRITPDSRLEDLGESLDLIEVVFALEVAFGIDIPFNVQNTSSNQLVTVGDVGRRIDALLSAKASKA